MANFLINSSSLLTEGTSAGELFLVQSPGVSATTIKAAAGEDTIQMLENAGSASDTQIYGEGGADTFDISGTTFSASTIFGGAGGDTLTINSATTFGGAVKVGDGSDKVILESGGTFQGGVQLGAGADLVEYSASFTHTTAQISLGAGKDTISFELGNASSLTVQGGGGDDVISADLAFVGSAVKIYGGAGNDTVDMNASATTDWEFNLGAGTDTIDAVMLLGSAAIIAGAGADSILVQEISGAGASVLGGGRNDTIEIQTIDAGVSAQILGGGGADSIRLDGTFSNANFASAEVYGGAGADSITLEGGAVASGLTLDYAIGIAEYSDSTLDSMDMITMEQAVEDSGSLVFRNDQDAVSAGTVSATAVSGTNGIFAFSATSELSSVSERVSFLDTQLESAGTFGVFTDSSASAGYLFIQGGATDTVIKLANDGNGLELISAAAANNDITIELD